MDKGKGNKIVATKSGTTHYKVFLDAKATKSPESIVMRIPSSSQEVYLDNIEISKVQTEELPKENFIFFDYNASSSPVSVPLDGTYKKGKTNSSAAQSRSLLMGQWCWQKSPMKVVALTTNYQR
ncbi:hypothetical protein V8V91_04810 [Algoriphagus halophilus]|uniref:hypothetical protein n=1 Tax=Algoriphagus halophilus TaxID=226505 RepID=UPI0035900245